MRPYLDAAEGDNLLQWQRLLARYAHWYVPAVAGGTKRSIGEDERLAFIGALQAVVQRPPTMTPIASRRTVLEPRRKRLNNADFDPPWKPSFSVEFWPHFRVQDVCRVVPSLCPLCRSSSQPGLPRRSHCDALVAARVGRCGFAPMLRHPLVRGSALRRRRMGCVQPGAKPAPFSRWGAIQPCRAL